MPDIRDILPEPPQVPRLVTPLQEFCSACGGQVSGKGIDYPDLLKWARERKEAKAKGIPGPPFPGPALTKCCRALPVFPPIPDIMPPLPTQSGVHRVESPDFIGMLRLCNAIGKSPHSIKAYLRLDVIPHLFGPAVYYIDVKARYFLERLKEFGL